MNGPSNSATTTAREPLKRAAEGVDRLKTLVLWTVTLGAIAAFVWLVVREVRTVRTVVEPIAVPEALRQQGYTSEVMSTVLIDQIAKMTESAKDREERSEVAAGWRTADVVVPTLNISLNATAGLFENLVGMPDTRISGEVVGDSGNPERYHLTLRVSAARNGWRVVEVPDGSGTAGWTPAEPIGRLLEQPTLALLLRIDPLSAASFVYVTEAERAESTEALMRSYESGSITSAIDRCLEECVARDRAAAYVLWANFLERVGKASDDRSLRDAALARLEQAANTGRLKSTDYTFWGDMLIELGRESEGFAKYDAAARAYPDDFLVPYNRGATLARLKRLDQALDQYSASAALDPGKEWTFFAWGDTLLRVGRPEEAEAKFRTAILLDSGIAPAYRGLADALDHQGRKAEADRMRSRADALEHKRPDLPISLTRPPSSPAPPAG